MEITLILGPMKSGKSFDLISYFAPLKYTKKKYALFHSQRNVRDKQIESRNGVLLEAKKISSFKDILDEDYEVIGIDEIHMFNPDEADNIRKLIHKGVKVVAAGLDMDYKGELFKIVQRLLELGPVEVKYRRAVCEDCFDDSAVYTQVYKNDNPITEGMPPVIPDDGTFTYAPVCRHCFVTK